MRAKHLTALLIASIAATITHAAVTHADSPDEEPRARLGASLNEDSSAVPRPLPNANAQQEALSRAAVMVLKDVERARTAISSGDTADALRRLDEAIVLGRMLSTEQGKNPSSGRIPIYTELQAEPATGGKSLAISAAGYEPETALRKLGDAKAAVATNKLQEADEALTELQRSVDLKYQPLPAGK